MMTNERYRQPPLPHQRTTISRLELAQAKDAAHKAYLSACRVLDLLDETADPAWIAHAEVAREHAWKLYEALSRETEW